MGAGRRRRAVAAGLALLAASRFRAGRWGAEVCGCSLGGGGPAVPVVQRRRRDLLIVSAGGAASGLSVGVAARAAAGGGGASAHRIGYSASSVLVGGSTIPLAVWYPVSEDARAQAAEDGSPYGYRISVAKLFRLFLGVSLPAFLAWTFKLPSRQPTLPGAAVEKASRPTVIFAHGYLGSRFDMLHLAELLVSRGFLVAAPEFAESLSATFEPTDATSRGAIMQATLQKLQLDFGLGDVGLIGHSAGGGTASILPGRFRLGRVAVAGGGLNYEGDDPLLVVASEGDCFFRRRWEGFRSQAETTATTYVGGEGAARLASLPLKALPRRAALLFDDGGRATAAATAAEVPPPPSHISFLDPRSNEAMVRFLSPLLPLARALGVPVLDFDVYAERPDSESTAAMVLPAIARFLQREL